MFQIFIGPKYKTWLCFGFWLVRSTELGYVSDFNLPDVQSLVWIQILIGKLYTEPGYVSDFD